MIEATMTDTKPKRRRSKPGSGVCARCGTTTSGGTYCRKCNGWAQSVDALLRTATADAALIRMHDDEHLPYAEIGRREVPPVSRQAIGHRIRKARRRRDERASMEHIPG
jgi:hypothetical protein